MLDIMVEDLIEEELIGPEIYDLSKEMAMETLEKTNNKVRKQEIKQVSFCLNFMDKVICV